MSLELCIRLTTMGHSHGCNWDLVVAGDRVPKTRNIDLNASNSFTNED